MNDVKKDTEAYLAKIRKTIKESENMIAQANLRIAETDRLLEKEGLTREQVLNMKFTPEQLAVVNKELERLGMDPLPEEEDASSGISSLQGGGLPPTPDPVERSSTAENRKRKFGVMMQQFKM